VNTPEYRYNRTDFLPLPVDLEHMDISLSFLEERVEGTARLRVKALQDLDEVVLDAMDLDIRSVECEAPDGGSGATDYRYLPDKAQLIVRLPRRVLAGETFHIRAGAACRPSGTLLEGIYRDTTPAGCPQQYISQCQQWGFQRILPVFDDCTAKCTMTTTIEADARYTHLVSNGDVCRETNPDGKPVPGPGDPSRQVITYENRVPMAPYLFIVAVGTWDVLEDEIVYPSGRRIRLEYLVPPGRKDGAVIPMRILKESVLWQAETQEYEYPYEVYRTICMEKSNFGGMENVGNTTIVTSAALVDEFTSDARLEYSYAVIVHEFEHNQCGSEVTMETPFDMWLNEAFTVDVERQFTGSRLDRDVTRLDEVAAMRAPTNGPLAVEDGGHLGNIVRQGFNHPDELVDGVTYVKAAEVINMLRLILGKDVFRRAKNLYFSRYHGANANTDQFFECFQEVSGKDLSRFKQEWLHTIGYPKIEAEWRYEEASRSLSVTFHQARSGKGGLFHVPVAFAAVDELGRDIAGTSTMVEITGERLALQFDDVPRPAFVSFNRDCSFYGTFSDRSATPDSLAGQIKLDANLFNRVEAMRRLTDRERIKLVHDVNAPIDDAWQETWAAVLREPDLPPGLRAYLLRIEEQSLDRTTLPMYRERYAARIRLLETLATRYTAELAAAFDAVDTYRRGAAPEEGIEERKLKAVLLRTLVEAGTPDVHRMAEDHFRRAWNFSDKASALRCINVSTHPRKPEFLEEAFGAWQHHLNGYTTYLAVVASGPHDDVFDLIAREEARPEFNIEHPGHSRALYLPVASNNRMLWTDAGIDWLARTVARLAPVNENTAIRLAAAFQHVARLSDDLKPRVVKALEAMREGVDAAKSASVAGRIRAYLDSVASDA